MLPRAGLILSGYHFGSNDKIGRKGHFISITYQDGKTEQWEYSGAASLHLIIRMVTSGGRQTVMNYDNCGNLAQLINNEAGVLRYGYDFNTKGIPWTSTVQHLPLILSFFLIISNLGESELTTDFHWQSEILV
jgi:hypothetical protein